MEQFKNIRISVPSCRVELCPGRDFALEYQLSSAYEVAEVGVADGTLFFQCRHRWPAALMFWNFQQNFVRVTWPAGAEFETISIKNISGEIRVTNVKTGRMTLDSTSGRIELFGASAKELLLRHISGSVTAASCIAGRLEGSGVSGSLRAERLDTGEMRYSSTSGSIRLDGKLKGSTDITTVSGSVRADIALPLEQFSYRLRSTSGCKQVNGDRAEIREVPAAANKLQIKTTSGGIHVHFDSSAPEEISVTEAVSMMEGASVPKAASAESTAAQSEQPECTVAEKPVQETVAPEFGNEE